jgi:uncharacterized protein
LITLAPAVLALACCDGPEARGERVAAARPGPAIALTGRVTDAADLLTVEQEQGIEAKLVRLEQDTGHQFVVVTAPSLGGRDVAAFTMDLANSWGVGRAEHEDGLVLLVAPNERKARIAVGYGLERVLTNAICEQIMQERIIPRFRAGDLPDGINAGVEALIARLR